MDAQDVYKRQVQRSAFARKRSGRRTLSAQCRNMGRFQHVDCPHPECGCTNVADVIRHRRTCANRRSVDNDMLKS